MKRFISFLLIMCVCMSFAACDNHSNSLDTSTPTTTPTSGMNFPDKTSEVLQYLKDKYDETFTCLGFSSDNNIFHCSSESFPVILVHSVASLDDSVNPSDFAGKYADNGYALQASTEIQRHYEQYCASIENHQLHVYMPAEAFPSTVTTANTYDENRSLYPQYFTPELYILYDGTLDSSLIEQLCSELQSNAEQVAVFVVQASSAQWNQITTDDLVWNLDNYSVLQSFTTIQDE